MLFFFTFHFLFQVKNGQKLLVFGAQREKTVFFLFRFALRATLARGLYRQSCRYDRTPQKEFESWRTIEGR
jgi:hypothetical protein